MSKLLYLKILVLVAALVAVFYVIQNVTADKVSQSLAKVGLEDSTKPGAPGATASIAGTDEKIILCRNRVRAIVWPDGRKIQETDSGMKRKWQSYNLDPVDIGYMDVEKWLSLNCEIPATVRDTKAAVGLEPKPFVTIEYIDGTKEALDRSNESVYRFAGREFMSPTLDQAMNDLVVLAGLQPTGP